MPKDRDTYRYIEVGLEWGSWVLAKFEEDAKKHQSKQPGKLLALRLAEYYEMKEREAQQSRGQPAPALVSNGSQPIQISPAQKKSGDHAELSQDDIIVLSQHTTENADEAADYWSAL
jgi:hypothetical protein